MTTKTLKIGMTIAIFAIMGSAVGAVPVDIAFGSTTPTGQSGLVMSNYDDTYKDPVNETEIYMGSYWNETTPETVREFFNIMPPCDWYDHTRLVDMCGLRARYAVIEAHQHGIELEEITLSHRTGVCGGHRVNTFEYDGVRYYTSNFNAHHSDIVDCDGLASIVKELMDIDGYGMKDHKVFTDDWFERNGY